MMVKTALLMVYKKRFYHECCGITKLAKKYVYMIVL